MSSISAWNLLCLLTFLVVARSGRGEENSFPGADEKTPSRSEYFTWINNAWEGSNESQTLANLDFFRWLHDTYGMTLDIYAFDAGNLDTRGGHYGSADSETFQAKFPHGFAPFHERAKAMGTRLGIWGGPDGFGNTPAEAQARIDLMASLCRDYDFALFKFDAACSGLRGEKQDDFIRMLTECRKSRPDLIVLNHRIDLGKGTPYATTRLWEGQETYIDVYMNNHQTAPHHRAGALTRGLTPNLDRLLEDHGVCLSSCLDYWEDDLILQAFSRCLLLAPEIYGNPWLLRDEEFPRLARIFNLHRRYRALLVHGMTLPERDYGPLAVSRGDANTRFLTLRNPGWNPVRYHIRLDASIGLSGTGEREVRLFHPSERILGRFPAGGDVEVEVAPFRACLLMATTQAVPEVGVMGCDYEVVRDVPGKPVVLKLHGLPGSKAKVQLAPGGRTFTQATLDGKPAADLLAQKSVEITFPGTPLKEAWHRKLGELLPVAVPADAEALYEATCYAADNNALEVRSLQRSGATRVPQVQKAREALFTDARFVELGIWDRNLFDGDPQTSLQARGNVIRGGALRVDFGAPVALDRLVIRTGKSETGRSAEVSDDLQHWTPISFQGGTELTAQLDAAHGVRYLRMRGTLQKIVEIEGYHHGKAMNRSRWRASNLFGPYDVAPAKRAWSGTFRLTEAAKGSYLAIALAGRHGKEGVYAALRVDGKPVGCPDRSLSYVSNVWEAGNAASDSNYTYYAPVTKEMIGKTLEVMALGLADAPDAALQELKPEVWLTAYPTPFETKELLLSETPKH